jgi:hypothetical protein
MIKYKVDIVCLQETVKEHFSISELRIKRFGWWPKFCFELDSFTGALGGGGRGLLGVKQGDLDTVEKDGGQFFSIMTIVNRQDNFCWKIINVYGLVKHAMKGEFLHEIY